MAKNGKTGGKRKVWHENPVGSKKGKARCECHYTHPCPRKVSAAKA